MTTKRVIIVAKRHDRTKTVSDISGIGVIEGDGVGAQVERWRSEYGFVEVVDKSGVVVK